jgi:hypothetical protein
MKRGMNWLTTFDRHIQRFLIGWKFANSLIAILNNKAILFHSVDEVTFPSNSLRVRSVCVNWSHSLLAKMWISGKCSPLWTTSWNAGYSKRKSNHGECMCISKLRNCSKCWPLWFVHDCIWPFMFKVLAIMVCTWLYMTFHVQIHFSNASCEKPCTVCWPVPLPMCETDLSTICSLKIPIKENNWAEVWWSWWPYLFWRPASHVTVSWYSN